MHCRKAKWSSELEPQASLENVPHSCDSQVELVVKNLPAKVGDTRDKGLIPGSERSPKRGNGHPLQYSCLKNPMDRGAWRATVYEAAESQTWLRKKSSVYHLTIYLSTIYPVGSVCVENHDWHTAAAAAELLQSYLTLCDPIDGSPTGFSVPGILQERTLEWVAISFSNAWKWKVKLKLLSRVRLLATPWTAASQAPPSMGFSRQEYWGGVPLPSPYSPLSAVWAVGFW